MRSRLARACTRISTLVATMFAGAATAQATTAAQQIQAQATPLESIGPVGLAAVVFGVTGMVAGVFRRKKMTVQPENQRKQ